MGRDELKSAAEPGGFVEYGKEQLPKIDSMRRDKSQPDFYGVPILRDEQVLYTTAEELGGKPASCYTCKEQNPDKTCERLGPDIKVQKVTGSRDSGDPIEYWPCCSMHEYGPGSDKVKFHDALDTPDSVGLIWINASERGQKSGGANCGGVEGGDDCDHYMVAKGEKWESKQGACRVLQHTVNAGDICTAWWDDDILEFPEAQQLIKGDKVSIEGFRKRRLVKSILSRDK
jgi:hypothetical protein